MTENPDTTQARIEATAMTCLEAFAREGEAAVARACADHPEDVAAVLGLLGELSSIGLLAAAPADPANAQHAGDRFGDFLLLRRLGGGGMGVVHLAEQQSLHRQVALKLMRPRSLHDARARERFRREVEALSRLDHPGICTVFEAGEIDETPYLAMRYLDGETLATRLARLRRTESSDSAAASTTAGVHAALVLVEKVARALHHAHEKGLVHRDVKPANVMLTAGDEPVLLDFGLAFAQAAAELTVSGDVLGTPAYMAPEQVSGDRAAVDRRTDVHALGVLLFECLTLRPPFAAVHREDLYRQILTEPPPDPRRQNRRIGGELVIVLGKAMEKEPRRRFATALEFAEELRRLRMHEPIRTRRPGLLLRAVRWSQRNPVAAAVLATTTLGLLVVLWLAVALAAEARGNQALAFAIAAADVGQRDPRLGFKLAREAVRLHPSPIGYERLQEMLGELYDVAVVDTGGKVLELSWSKDGARLLAGCAGTGPRLLDGDGRLLAELLPGDKATPWAARFAPHARELAVGDQRGRVHVFDHEGKEQRSFATGTRAVSILDWSPDGSQLLVVAGYVRAFLYTAVGELVAELRAEDDEPPHRTGIQCTAWDPDGMFVATAGGHDDRSVPDGDHTVRLWDRAGNLLHTLAGHTHTISSIACARDRIVTASLDGTARIWRSDGALVHCESFPNNAVNSAAFDAAGARIVVGTRNGTVRVLDRDGRQLENWRSRWTVPDAAFSPDGTQIVTASWDGQVQLWDLRGREVLRLRGHLSGVYCVAFAPDGAHIASGSWDGTARIWQLTPRGARVRADHAAGAHGVAVTPDGERIVSTDSLGGLYLRARDGTLLRSLPASGNPAWSLRIARDGHTAVAVNMGGAIVLWDTNGGEPRRLQFPPALGDAWNAQWLGDGSLLVAAGGRLFRWHAEAEPRLLYGTTADPGPRSILCMDLSPDGQRLLTSGLQGDVVVRDLEGRELRPMLGHTMDVPFVAFSPDGTRAVTASEDRTVRVWDLATGKELSCLRGHQGGVKWAGFVPGTNQILSGGLDDALRLWDLDSGQTVLSLRGHRAGVWSGFLMPDGRQAISASKDGTLRWWWLRGEDIVAAADRLGIDELSAEDRSRLRSLLGQ